MDKFTIIYLILVNLSGLILMGLDKKKARSHSRRTAENLFMLIAAIGGSLGVYCGIWIFNHKTRKLKFTLGIPIMALIEFAIVLLYLSNI